MCRLWSVSSREPGGQEKIQRYTYYVAIPMAVLQALGQISIFNLATGTGAEIIPGFGLWYLGSNLLLTVSVLTTMTAGTMFAIWLGELITEARHWQWYFHHHLSPVSWRRRRRI